MSDCKFGFSDSQFIELVCLKEGLIPALADEAEEKIASKPTQTVHSPSSSPSVETQQPLHPPAAFCPPVTDQPTLQLATLPDSGAPSNASPHVIAESEEETLQPTIFFSLGNILDSFIQCHINFTFRYSMVSIQHRKCCHRSLAIYLWIEWQYLCRCVRCDWFKTKEKGKYTTKTIIHHWGKRAVAASVDPKRAQ